MILPSVANCALVLTCILALVYYLYHKAIIIIISIFILSSFSLSAIHIGAYIVAVIDNMQATNKPTVSHMVVSYNTKTTEKIKSRLRRHFKLHFYDHSYMVMLLEKPLDTYFILCVFDCVITI